MRSFPDATRTAYLSGDVTPIVRATIRRLRLDFGATLYQDNDGGVIGANTFGDDYNDIDGLRTIWGDSCVTTEASKASFRLISPAAYTSGGSTSLFRSRSTPGSDSWTFSSQTGTGDTLAAYTRLGVHPGAAGVERYYAWYIDDAQDLYRNTLTQSTWAWSSKTAALDLSAFSGAAVHPVSATDAIVVAYEDPTLWVKYLNYDGDWDACTADHVVHQSDSLCYMDPMWSDAVVSPSDSNKIVVALNLSRWGSAYSLLYDKTSGLWSQPREILPSAEQWGNLKVWVSGLTVIDGRIWGVTVREPVGSGNVNMAHHVALISSLNGTDWTDEYYVTTSALRGKLLHVTDQSYCHVVGNAGVARAGATNRLGYDNSSMKYQVDEAYALSIVASGPGSAPEVTVQAQNVDDSLSDSGLLETGNELTVELGAESESYGDYCKALLTRPERFRTYDEDIEAIRAVGYMSKLMGDGAYKPVAAKVFDGPYPLYSNFNFDNGNGRLTVRQETGMWKTEKVSSLGRYALFCKTAGISIVPHSFSSQSMVATTAFQCKVSVEGVCFVFWWEDASNYWQAGIVCDYTGAVWFLQIDRYVDGVKTNKDYLAVDSGGAVFPGDWWYVLHLEVAPGLVRISLNRSDSYDFSSPDESVSYDTTNETAGIPESHHIGLKVFEFEGWEGSTWWGVVDAATESTMTDNLAVFSSADRGRWLRCHDQWRQIIYWDTTTLTIAPVWVEVPVVGDEFGVYTDDGKAGPQAYFRDLWICEGMVPYTVDDVTNSVLALCGVSRSDVYTGTDVPAIGASVFPYMNDVDITLTSTNDLTGFYFWLSSMTNTGETAYSGMGVVVDATTTTLYTAESNASVSSPYVTYTAVKVYPNLVTLPGTPTLKPIRLQANKDYILVSTGGHFITAFPVLPGYPYGGYSATASVAPVDAYKTEFPALLDSFIWDTNTVAAVALYKLMRGRRAKLVEREDGSVAISRFDDSPLGMAGTYTTPIVALTEGQSAGELFSLVEMVGAEDRAFYIDEIAARRVLRYERADNPTLDTQEQAMLEAKKLTELGRQRSEGGAIQLYAPDPALELEDAFVAGGETYRVEGVETSLQASEGTLALEVQIRGRKELSTGNTGTWGNDADGFNWDDGTVWG